MQFFYLVWFVLFRAFTRFYSVNLYRHTAERLTFRTYEQLLLVQNGKLYGRDPMFAVITRAAGLPEVTKNHDIQKNEYIVQLGQVKTIIII